MNCHPLRSAFALALTLPALALAQGSLTPPGAPAEMMKTLSQIEPRTPVERGAPGVNAEDNGGFTIFRPGSYYLTASFSVGSGNGITIAASDVTLDLNGFTITSTANPSAGIAILVAPSQQNLTIRDGHISGSFTVDLNTGKGSGSGFERGIYSFSAISNTLVSGLTIRGTSDQAVYLDKGSTIERCVAEHCGGTALRAQIVTNSSAIDCNSGIAGETLNNCHAVTYGIAINATRTATNCTGESINSTGLVAAVATNCRGTSGDNIGLAAGVATACEGRSTAYIGLRASQSATGCFGRSWNGPHGLLVEDASGATPVAGTADNCVGEVTYGIGTGLQTGLASNCRGTAVGGTGLRAANAENSQGTSNSGAGLYAEQTAAGCTGTTDTGTYGLYAGVAASDCRGYNKSATGMSYGLYVLGSATGCSGTSGYGRAGLFADVALNCAGACPGGSYGLLAQESATNCTGTIMSASNTVAGSAAIRAGVATGCVGENLSTVANTYGILALISAHNSTGAGIIGIRAATSANYCQGVSTGATSPVAITTGTAIGCTSGGGTITATNKFLMP